MAYTAPKTDWTEAYTPSPSDMNRIEGNTEDNRAEINSNAADILLEESARIAADATLDESISELRDDVGLKNTTSGAVVILASRSVNTNGGTATPYDIYSPINGTILVRLTVNDGAGTSSMQIFVNEVSVYSTSITGLGTYSTNISVSVGDRIRAIVVSTGANDVEGPMILGVNELTPMTTLMKLAMA